MAQKTILELIDAAALAEAPSFPPATSTSLGGVDPLGMRQINFDLMDRVFPGLNNVARHVRPFTVVAWACRRARQLAETMSDDEIDVDLYCDFVDRIEVIYAWSQFLLNPNADLPGRQVLTAILRKPFYEFGGEDWKVRRKDRRYSTAFTAPVNYGPALKTLGWVVPHDRYRQLLIARPEVEPALDAFEALISDRLDHPAFSQLGPLTVDQAEAKQWGPAWAFDTLTTPEKAFMRSTLLEANAPVTRRNGGALMTLAADLSTGEPDSIRAVMASDTGLLGNQPDLLAANTAWRRVQVRQTFRLALEALLYWVTHTLFEGPRTSAQLAERLIEELPERDPNLTAGKWLAAATTADSSPTTYINRLRQALTNPPPASLATEIIDAINFCVRETAVAGEVFERADRMPVARAQSETAEFFDSPVKDFVMHILQSWVLAQHVYWSVGRGLADARSGGKTIQRLKIVLEDEGWSVAPGITTASAPLPTPDRLETMLSLARECNVL